MRRTFTAVLGACLLAASPGVAQGQSQAPVPDPAGQRIERSESGFAISIPTEWEHQDAATYDEDWWDGDYGDPWMQHERFIADGGRLRARSSRGFLASHEQCYLYDWTDYAASPPAWITLDDAMDYYADSDDGRERSGVSVAFMDLPAGRVLRVDTPSEKGFFWRDYLFTDDTIWFMLVCGAEDPPDDRWLSIAETLEFLPTGN